MRRGVIGAAALAGGVLLAAGAAAQPGPDRGQGEDRPLFSVQEGRPTLSLGDGRVTLQPQLRLDLDGGGFRDQPLSWDGEPPRFLGQDRPGVPAQGLNLRRARIGLRGSLPGDLTYSALWAFEVSPGSQPEPGRASRLFELQLAWSGIEGVTLRAGAFTPRHTIEFAMSSFELTLMERPAIIALATSLASGDGRLGFGGEAQGERWFAAAYATGGSTLTLNDGRQRGLVGRANAVALRGGGAQVVLGANAAVQLRPGLAGAPEEIRLRDYPELRLDPLRLLDTGAIPASGGLAVGPEVAALLGPLYLQSEYQWIRIDGAEGAGTRRFEGYYVTAALPLLGPPRRYDAGRGVFRRPDVSALDPRAGQWGWAELAARWSHASLTDGPVRGGRQGIASVALNWYPTEALRLTLQASTGAVRLDGPDRAFTAVAGRVALSW